MILLVDKYHAVIYNNVKLSCKGGTYMRKHYLDNIRWGTQIIVVLYLILEDR